MLRESDLHGLPAPRLDPALALRRLARLPHPLSLAGGFLGEPVLAAAPAAVLALEAAAADPFDRLAAVAVPAGGLVAGTLSYELGRSLERLPSRAREWGLPRAALLSYSAAYWPRRGLVTGAPGAAAALREALSRPLQGADLPLPFFCGPPRFDLSDAAYRRAVRSLLARIRRGDLYQANLSRGLVAPLRGPALSLHERLAAAHPARFGAYLDLGEWQLSSNSPELLLEVRGRRAVTRPIKGTRPRGAGSREDRALREELLADEKERAEHAMIVDVSRHDLGRVAATGSVRVRRLMRVESLPTVHHLVSDVTATLRPGVGPWDALRAAFPAASITGAPKVKAEELIDELEPEARGVYCGSIFALAEGRASFSVAIRTAVAKDGELRWRAGGGIVEGSDPDRELAETRWKSRAFLRAAGLPVR